MNKNIKGVNDINNIERYFNGISRWFISMVDIMIRHEKITEYIIAWFKGSVVKIVENNIPVKISIIMYWIEIDDLQL